MSGNTKKVNKMVENNCNYFPLDQSVMMHIIGAKYHKLMKIVAGKFPEIYIDSQILIGCSRRKWYDVLSTDREDCNFWGLNDNQCIISILKFDKDVLFKRVLTKMLDYNGENEEIVIYLCKHKKNRLMTHLIDITFIDPNHNNNIFIKAAVKVDNYELIEIFRKSTAFVEDDELHKHIEFDESLYRQQGI